MRFLRHFGAVIRMLVGTCLVFYSTAVAFAWGPRDDVDSCKRNCPYLLVVSAALASR